MAMKRYATSVGVILQSRHPTRVILPNVDGHETITREILLYFYQQIEFTELAILDFTSKRKRSTIVFQSSDGILVLTKGAGMHYGTLKRVVWYFEEGGVVL